MDEADRKAYHRAWYRANKAKCDARSTAWRLANPEKSRVIHRRYVASHPEELRANARVANKKRYAADPEKAKRAVREWALANPERVSARSRAWVKANPDAKKAKDLRRKAHGRVTAADVREVKAMCDGVCSYCLTPGLELAVEHIVPISRGGTNDPLNLVMACALCNARKGTKSLLKFMLGATLNIR